MCGILCQIRYSQYSAVRIDKISQRLNNRGPDCTHSVEITVGSGIKLLFCGAVLWMRGPEVIHQPIENNHGVLLYNGDIFEEAWDMKASDTMLIMEKLSNAAVDDSAGQHIIQVLKSLKGPFSIIYYDKLTQDLYFTRDKLGRNSLLYHRNDGTVMISSVLGRKYPCIEIPSTKIHILNLNTDKVRMCSWDSDDSKIDELLCVDWLNSIEKEQSLPDEQFIFNYDSLSVNLDDKDLIGYIQSTAEETKCKLSFMGKLLENNIIKETVSSIIYLLKKSVKIRLEAQPNKCKNCIRSTAICNHCTVGILFSGGLDCTILAFLTDKYLPKEQSIELINVAFKKESKASYDVPDRLTGIQSFEELKTSCQSRNWLFREINVPKDELEKHQNETIAELVYPRQTILDESLGSALWFAARGQDDVSISPCRVILLGSGADELFGGYTRHRKAFKRQSWSGLDKELHLDWYRISFRNLARDNRVICDHGRQPRMPYLDEDFTDYVLKLKPWLKCFPNDSLGPGVGDKLMLRLVAFELGLREVVTFRKRALQFGSRIANKKENGSDMSKRFLSVIND